MLVAPLNWGLGHATRCVPIIDALIKADFEPVLASDGVALEILKEAFPKLKAYELPGYNIKYSKSSWNFKLQLLFSVPRISKTVKKEFQAVQKIVEDEKIDGIISDNRFGVYHKKIPSVYITHQLTVLAGVFTNITTRIHQQIISNFDECWVPDSLIEPNLTGQLSHFSALEIPVKKMGILSRIEKKSIALKYDVAIVLSGPEPQRTILEKKVLSEFSEAVGKTILVRGVLENEPLNQSYENLEIINYANKERLTEILNSSEIIISRSGYSTIMDLAVLGKKALFIPTPGQTEQEYLAKRMQDLIIAPFVKQEQITFSRIKEVKNYHGFKAQKVALDLKLFGFFHSE